MINFKEIFIAWKSYIKPTKLEEKIAKDRLDVCIGCKFKKEIFEKREWSAICGKCGCPLKAKIFSKEINPCPMGYWINVDNLNGINYIQKDKKTFL